MENTVCKTTIKRREGNRCCGDYFDSCGIDRPGCHFQVTTYQPCTDNIREDYKRERGNLGSKHRNLRDKHLKGEVTAYLSLVFILLVAFVGAMIESASVQIAKNYRRADMNRAVESIFAEYQKELLEEYDIFALEGSYETGDYTRDQIIDRLVYYGASGIDQEVTRIQFLTDNGCQAFYEQVAAYMEHKYGLNRVQEMLGTTDLWQSQDEQAQKYADENEQRQEALTGLLTENEGELPTENNPIDHINALKTSPILQLVFPKEREISKKSIELSETISRRNLNAGYGDFSDVADGTGTLSRLLYGEYVMEHFQMASDSMTDEISDGITDEMAGRALDYELEYILAGKGSDKENLEEVVGKLLLLRFVPNYAYIQTDAEMKSEAEALALTLCSLLAVPAITEAAAQVILLTWAYAEAVVDLRSLLKGNKVPLVKSKESWQIKLSSLMTLGTADDHNDGADIEGGLPYKEYLRMLLFLKKKEDTARRTLDLIEQNLRTKYGLGFFRADYCISLVEFLSTCSFRRGITYAFPTYFGYN